ncbi:SDR family NAD(P)-dependent oxidoreductase [Halosquirtibacter xylanolyticus]|uniref:SDR family NAD(P)-dependent oxidoreductase n=1 Tax=Halosquirtibacter xylanolyticus TaxID=3374599 RepID=UPI00374812AE|nr:SDR family NAD(P)-dependent oxidoreductase [Prolixibacteraceae bacterium]
MKNILIIGCGPGLGLSLAKTFGMNGNHISLISRNINKLNGYKEYLKKNNIPVIVQNADVENLEDLKNALNKIREKISHFDVVIYNAASLRLKDVLEDTPEQMLKDYKINTLHALEVVKYLYTELKANKGTVLLTGGGFALHPNPRFGSLSMGKAALRNLSHQLYKKLRRDKIFVGTVTITDFINKESDKYSPDKIAEQFYTLYLNKDQNEIIY